MANLQFFNEVFSKLSTNKKKEILRLLIKEIIFLGFEDGGSQGNGNGGKNENGNGNGNGKIKKGQIKMGLWDLPPIGPSTLDSASFAENKLWLPEQVKRENLPGGIHIFHRGRP